MRKSSGYYVLALSLIVLTSKLALGQKYDHFEVKNNDLFWGYTYEYKGSRDSLRGKIVQMIRSKFFTFNVTRNEAGYSGELNHYKVDCKKYGRTYLNTPRMYWEGEWTGKFVVEVVDGAYKVMIYALYFEKKEQSTGYYRTEKPVKGRYIDAVTKKNKTQFRKNEFSNLVLMSLSLKDQFDIGSH